VIKTPAFTPLVQAGFSSADMPLSLLDVFPTETQDNDDAHVESYSKPVEDAKLAAEAYGPLRRRRAEMPADNAR
jgi:hypothetical protein